MTMEAKDLAEGLFQVLATANRALALEVVHPDFHNREANVAPAASSQPGPAGVLASATWMRFAFSDLRFPILGTASNGQQIWVRLRMQGRHTGAFVRFRDGALDQAVPPTGKEIDFEQIHVLDLRDGKVVGHEAVRDDITMLGQLGVFPPSPKVGARMLAWKITGRAAREAARVSSAAAQAAAQVSTTSTQAAWELGHLFGTDRGAPNPAVPARSGTGTNGVIPDQGSST